MIKYGITFFTCLLALLQTTLAQPKPAYTPRVEPCDCPVKVDSHFNTRCGYLIVPENRKKNNGKTIKLPFIIVKSNNPNKRNDPVLFTTGGPGGSSLGWATGATQHSFINNRDCIAFEQRGTRYALPNLGNGKPIIAALQEAYRKNLSKDSMVLQATQRYKNMLEAKGIDLSGYNTDETVSDIDDLLVTLGIDSVNLFGGSYSGGLMLAVLRKDSARVRSLILDSPLPTFVPIDEDEPVNFNEALNELFARCEKDSTDRALYGNLKERFQQYFTSIGNQPFYIPYVEKGSTDTLQIAYTRSDLLNIIENILFDYRRIKEIPYLITELIKGHHQPYVKNMLDDLFSSQGATSGMRFSVYCADQTAYHDEAILKQVYQVYPYMEGYHINDVYKELCDCWKVPPIQKQTKQPFYSNKPALLGDGAFDPACRPLYCDRIHHYMPNSQRVLFTERSHMVFGGKEGDAIIQAFLNNPYKKVEYPQNNIVFY